MIIKQYIVKTVSHALRNKTFAKLYMAQTVSLLGDAFSWVGLALLAYQLIPTDRPLYYL